MKAIVEKAIYSFVKGIDKGPFKCLKLCDSDHQSNYVEKQNANYGSIFDCAVYQAWLDMCRTVKGNNTCDERFQNIRRSISNALRLYFNGNPHGSESTFETWFGKLKKDAPEISVGQFQKIVNMAFKYLFCCEDYRKQYSDHFAWCHMPLDGLTLKWYKTLPNATKHVTSWSSIEDASVYFLIEKEIRDELKGKTVLEEEFIIWQQEKQKQKLTQLKSCLESVVNANDFLPEISEALVAEMRDILGKLT